MKDLENLELFRAAVALARFGAPRKDAENGTRDGRAPHFNFGFRRAIADSR
jgi:hypothetical protein